MLMYVARSTFPLDESVLPSAQVKRAHIAGFIAHVADDIVLYEEVVAPSRYCLMRAVGNGAAADPLAHARPGDTGGVGALDASEASNSRILHAVAALGGRGVVG